MAIGDDAIAAGMPTVNGAVTPANTIDTLITETRDFIAQGKLKDGALAPTKLQTVTVAKGGTGGTTAPLARANLLAVGYSGGVVNIRWDQPSLSFYPSINGAETAYLLRVDQGDARYVRRVVLEAVLEKISELEARIEALEHPQE